MFARLRGVPEKRIKEVVEIELTRLDLKEHADKRCEKYRWAHELIFTVAIQQHSYPLFELHVIEILEVEGKANYSFHNAVSLQY